VHRGVYTRSGTIAAREFGLPAVVATSTGTRVFTTGQLLEVDGGGGTVRVVETSN